MTKSAFAVSFHTLHTVEHTSKQGKVCLKAKILAADEGKLAWA